MNDSYSNRSRMIISLFVMSDPSEFPCPLCIALFRIASLSFVNSLSSQACMSFLAQRSAAGVPVSTGKSKVKHAIFEIFAGVTCNYKAIDYKNAVLGLLTGQQMLKAHTNYDGDNTLVDQRLHC